MAGEKVLLVDDEQDFLEFMGERIRSWGYLVLRAKSGKEAIAALEKENPQIIILDYMMPEMNGVEALKEIRRLMPQVPVIMLTAYPQEQVIKDALELGVVSFVPKVCYGSDAHDALQAALKIAEKKIQSAKEQ
jgi:CheY-like chemotaxis protein